MFKKILIANRGEIALRILRACRELGIKTVAIHSDVDENAMHVRMADESICVGPASAQSSYLNIPAITTAATLTNVDAIHPGYGFLSENIRFAEITEEHQIKFIGPNSKHIKMMGNKIEAKKVMEDIGVPTIPGINDIKENKNINNFIKKNGLPVIIKAASGGGGKGMRVVYKEEEINNNIIAAKAESKKSFNDDTVYIEKFLTSPKHIEIQIVSDGKGNVISLGERDCSIQRKHQKIVEESPSTVLSNDERNHINNLCIKAIKSLGYEGVGTLEFLYENKNFYFMEMNTRLQVEHPITEMVTGVDLVKEQILIANGEFLKIKQNDIELKGHSIECRINAENSKNFKPSTGTIGLFHPPAGNGIRLDTFIYSGYKVPHYYDNLLAKLIATGRTRNHAIKRALRSLNEIVIDGIDTNIELHKKILSSKDFKHGSVSINWLESNIASL